MFMFSSDVEHPNRGKTQVAANAISTRCHDMQPPPAPNPVLLFRPYGEQAGLPPGLWGEGQHIAVARVQTRLDRQAGMATEISQMTPKRINISAFSASLEDRREVWTAKAPWVTTGARL